ncbi:MAG: NAD(P)H-hydrate epimerase, partial [Flavobacteriales bacterium]|nr:NAD(P)H-hydrate epimerase [Flavobacteriales bacterium]
MKLLTAEQIRKLDQLTIEREPISSLDLMERAALRCVDWIWLKYPKKKFAVLAGTGNNGGDGLAIARMLSRRDSDVEVYVFGDRKSGSADFASNLKRLEEFPEVRIYFLDEENHLLSILPERIIVDAIFGTGLSRKIDGWRGDVIKELNELPNNTIAIDIPSGMFAEQWKESSDPIIRASDTLTFQMPKLSFLFRESHRYTGRINVLNIGLDREARQSFDTPFHLTTRIDAKALVKSFHSFDHKGDHGQVQIIAGSKGSMGAAVLSTQAALRSGAGLVRTHVPKCGLNILQITCPEAMCS